MSPEGLQCDVDSGVCTQDGLVLVGKGFVFVHLWRRIGSHAVLHEFHSWHVTVPVIIVRDTKEVFHRCGGRSWGAWRAGWSRFTFWTLKKEKIKNN